MSFFIFNLHGVALFSHSCVSRYAKVCMLIAYTFLCSVALLVDNPALFNRMADLFVGQASTKFVILLWGEKSDLSEAVSDRLSVFNYSEIIAMGKESRKHLSDSYDASKAGFSHGFIIYFFAYLKRGVGVKGGFLICVLCTIFA